MYEHQRCHHLLALSSSLRPHNFPRLSPSDTRQKASVPLVSKPCVMMRWEALLTARQPSSRFSDAVC